MVTVKERQRIQAERDHRAMILAPELWVNWPMLPLKRGDVFNGGDCGIILDEPRDEGFTVYIANLFNVPKDKAGWKQCKSFTYETVDELLDANWIVD